MNLLPNAAKLRRMNDQSFVLDASAVLAFLYNEIGAERVSSAFQLGRISSVNLSEVVAKLTDDDVCQDEIESNLADINLDVVPFDQALALRAGLLRSVTRSCGLSLGDRACLATAESLGLAVLTADRAWAKLDLDIPIELLR